MAKLDINERLAALTARASDVWTLDACGVTRSETAIPALVHREAYAAATSRTRLLLIGGLSGEPEDVKMALSALESYLAGGDALTGAVALSALPCGNPDGLSLDVAPGNGIGGVPGTGYPPDQGFFGDSNTEID